MLMGGGVCQRESRCRREAGAGGTVDCPVAALARGDETRLVRMDVNWPTDQSNGPDAIV